MQLVSALPPTAALNAAIDTTKGKSALGILSLQNNEDLSRGTEDSTPNPFTAEFTRRVASLLRECDQMIELADDRICVILDNLIDVNHVSLAGLKIQRVFDARFEHDNRSFPLVVRSGFVYLGRVFQRTCNADELYNRAESTQALAIANDVPFKMCTAENEHSVENHWQINERVQTAMLHHHISMDYQPKCCLSDGSLAGAEALVRWRDSGVVVAPDEYMPALSDDVLWDLTVYSYRRVLREAVDHEFSVPVGINISPTALAQPAFLDFMKRETSLWGVDPSLITLEIADSESLYDAEKSLHVIEAVKSMGFNICIDDFGLGGADLTRLERLPVDEIKIEASLTSNVRTDSRNLEATHAIIDIAVRLRIPVVAQGIEDAQTLQILHDLGCNLGQGFYLGAPLPVDQIGVLMD